MNDLNVPANQQIQISGHKQLQSLNNYAKLNDTQQKNISRLLTKSIGAESSPSYPLPLVSAPHKTPSSTAQKSRESLSTPEQNASRTLTSLFSGNIMNTSGNLTIHIHQHHGASAHVDMVETQPKRRRILPISESDSD